jgi:hypothetical protein
VKTFQRKNLSGKQSITEIYPAGSIFQAAQAEYQGLAATAQRGEMLLNTYVAAHAWWVT